MGGAGIKSFGMYALPRVQCQGNSAAAKARPSRATWRRSGKPMRRTNPGAVQRLEPTTRERKADVLRRY